MNEHDMVPAEQLEREFVARVIEMAAVKVKYAIERNVPRVLEDIQRQQDFFGDSERPDSDKINVTVSMCIERPLPHYARLAVTGVSWATKVRRKDADFEAGEVDIDAPYLPGMDPVMSGRPAAPAPAQPAAGYQAKNIQEANLLKAASEMGKEVYRGCRDIMNPNWRRTVEEWTGREWRAVLCEDAGQADRVMAAAEDVGAVVIKWHGAISDRSVRTIVDEEYDLCDFGKDCVKVAGRGPKLYEFFIGETIPTRYRDAEAYRAGGGLEITIYQGALPEGDDAEQADDAQGDDAEQADDAQGDDAEQADDAQGDDAEQEDDAQGDDAEQADDAQADDPEQEDGAQADEPEHGDDAQDDDYMTDRQIDRNAEKLHAAGFKVAYIDRDGKTVLFCEGPSSFPFAWMPSVHSTKKQANEKFRQLRVEQGAIDPSNLSSQPLSVGFTIIREPLHMNSINRVPYYAIREMTTHGGWIIHSKYDTQAEALTAYLELIKNPMILEG